eukprot:scaffold57598_cov52-Attheya_sp.AAC.1
MQTSWENTSQKCSTTTEKSTYQLSVLEELDQRTTDDALGNTPTSGEIALALRKAANGKAPGESGITADAL